MWPLIKLQARAWIKSPSPIFTFMIPTIFLLIMQPIAENSASGVTGVIASVITITMISAGLMNFGFTMFELRKSVIMKRIGSTQMSKPEALVGFFGWHFMLIMVQVIYIFFIGWLMSNVSGYYSSDIDFANIAWVGVLYAVLIGTVLSLVLGFFFLSISSTIEVFNMFTFLYFFIASFMGGIFIPSTGLVWMTWVGYFIPHTYVAELMSHSFAGYNVWALGQGYATMIPDITTSDPLDFVYVDIWKANMNIFFPLASTAFFAGVSLKTFKWDAR